MIGLCREDTGGRLEIGLVGDQRRRALIGRHADIFEDERAEQEVLVAGIGIERAGRPDRRPAARAAAVNAPFAPPSILIAGCATAAEPSTERRKVTCAASSAAISRAYCATTGSVKVTWRPPDDGAASRTVATGGHAYRKARAIHRADVELRLEIFEVQREVEHVEILLCAGRWRRRSSRCRGRSRGRGRVVATACGEQRQPTGRERWHWRRCA